MKLAKLSNYKCRVCKQSLVGEESLNINHVVPTKLGGDERYDNLELLHQKQSSGTLTAKKDTN
nr:HNH endonuclease [Clostridium sp. CF011]